MKHKKIFFAFCIILFTILIIMYLVRTYTPLYDARLTLDIRNNTFSTVDNVIISYGESEKEITIPPIKPLGRIIVIPSIEDVKSPVSEVYVSHGGGKSLVIKKYRPKSSDYAIITITTNGINIKHDDYMSNPLDFVTFRWYGKIVDMNSTVN